MCLICWQQGGFAGNWLWRAEKLWRTCLSVTLVYIHFIQTHVLTILLVTHLHTFLNWLKANWNCRSQKLVFNWYLFHDIFVCLLIFSIESSACLISRPGWSSSEKSDGGGKKKELELRTNITMIDRSQTWTRPSWLGACLSQMRNWILDLSSLRAHFPPKSRLGTSTAHDERYLWRDRFVYTDRHFSTPYGRLLDFAQDPCMWPMDIALSVVPSSSFCSFFYSNPMRPLWPLPVFWFCWRTRVLPTDVRSGLSPYCIHDLDFLLLRPSFLFLFSHLPSLSRV